MVNHEKSPRTKGKIPTVTWTAQNYATAFRSFKPKIILRKVKCTIAVQ